MDEQAVNPRSQHEAGSRSAPPTRLGTLARVTRCACWLYLFLILGTCALVQFQIDNWWPATLVGYGPRYVFAAPLGLLVPLSLWKFRGGFWLLVAAGILVAWPIMGFQAAFGPTDRRDSAEEFRFLSANMGGGATTEALLDLIDRELPDVIALQEYSPRRDHKVFVDRGWFTESRGGLFCASRFPIRQVETVRLNPEASWEVRIARFEIEASGGPIGVFLVHLPTVRDGLQAVIGEKWKGIPKLRHNSQSRMVESQAVSQWVRSFAGPKVILGDFNLPAESAIYRECWSSFENAFGRRGTGFGFTKFTNYHGVRIDHILSDRSWATLDCRIGPDLGGDHRPVLADLARRESS
jgi:vancomycin resistance protein VanJ